MKMLSRNRPRPSIENATPRTQHSVGEGLAGELRALIRVQDLRSRPDERVVQGPDAERGVHRVGLELSRFDGRLISVVERLRCCSRQSLSDARERLGGRARGAPQAAWFLSWEAGDS